MTSENAGTEAESAVDGTTDGEPAEFLAGLASRLRNLRGVDTDVATVVAKRIVSGDEAAGGVESALADLRALAQRRAGGEPDG